MVQNPSLEVGIDGSLKSASTDSASTGSTDQDPSNRQVSAVRDTLAQAGVPAYKVQTERPSISV
jgi:hypothetical protein